MFNEMDRLTGCALLQALLAHYAELAGPDRHVWHARRTEGDARELTRLHGELIAYGWLEINLDEVATCYRATTGGLRALKQVSD